MSYFDKTFGKEEVPNNISPFEEYHAQWISLQDIEPKIQPWFWPGIIPSSTLTLIGGHGGIGKSLLLLYLAAKTSTGESFSAGGTEQQLKQGSVILLSAEDDEEMQIKPKLLAERADLSKIYLLKSKLATISGKKKFIELDKDIYLLEQKIQETGDVRLIIIDPITYFIGEIKDHVNADVANFLQRLIDLAKKHDIAIVMNKHLRKQGSGSKGAALAADEVGGAGAWTNTPRRCWLITNHHDDQHVKVLTKMKDNFGAKQNECIGYKIELTTVIHKDLHIKTTKLVWQNELFALTSEQAVSEEKYEKSKLSSAIELIVEYLKTNGTSRRDAIAECLLIKGVKHTTFRRACDELEKDMLIKEKGIRGAIVYSLRD